MSELIVIGYIVFSAVVFFSGLAWITDGWRSALSVFAAAVVMIAAIAVWITGLLWLVDGVSV